MKPLFVDEWTPISFYCENCRSLVTGFVDSTGVVKAQCENCRVKYKKKIVSPTKSVTESYAPPGEQILCVQPRD